MVAEFQTKDKIEKPRFFQEKFLVANTKFKVILERLFLKINNTNISFNKKTLTWKSYIISKILSNNKQV